MHINDGVLHRGDSFINEQGVVSSAPGEIELFEFAALLADLLEPLSHVQIVLSTDWVLRFGFEEARDHYRWRSGSESACHL
ncbi:hypothetical protein K788_00002125 [Paraburkholderia caribensis MBA4]|uniref:Uncharacterized protein n=1 Tax=Paraburkholderia caribensis MBA4 TaxID=1323664 RepID=A0A0P0RJ12_9BURK|nr:hypothetical protein K788_00002125 [Paraburkholderia caribensis MBA4]